MVEKIEDLLAQKLENDSVAIENNRSLVLCRLPSVFSLIEDSLAFYRRSFLRIFAFGSLFFLLFATSITLHSVYFGNKITLFAIAFVFLVFYISTLIGLVIEEESTIASLSRNALQKLPVLLYSCVIFLLVIVGAMVIISVPGLVVLSFTQSAFSNATLSVIFVVLVLAVALRYLLFLFVAIDNECQSFRAMIGSQICVKTNLPDYLKCLTVCIALVSIMFAGALYIVRGMSVAWDAIGYFLNSNSNLFDFKAFLKPGLESCKITMDDYVDMLAYWFLRIVFIIPLTVIYLGFVYSSLNCRGDLVQVIDESWLHKTALVILACVGFVSALGLYFKMM